MKNDTSKQLCKQIFRAINSRGYTYEKCCDVFNSVYKSDIEHHGLRKLNKDFLYRIKKNNFCPTNIRVIKLCEFLRVDTADMRVIEELSQEALLLDDLLKKRPELSAHIGNMINGLIGVTES